MSTALDVLPSILARRPLQPARADPRSPPHRSLGRARLSPCPPPPPAARRAPRPASRPTSPTALRLARSARRAPAARARPRAPPRGQWRGPAPDPCRTSASRRVFKPAPRPSAPRPSRSEQLGSLADATTGRFRAVVGDQDGRFGAHSRSGPWVGAGRSRMRSSIFTLNKWVPGSSPGVGSQRIRRHFQLGGRCVTRRQSALGREIDAPRERLRSRDG